LTPIARARILASMKSEMGRDWRTPGRWTFAFAMTALYLFARTPIVHAMKPGGGWLPPPVGGGCTTDSIPVVSVSAKPNFGSVAPTLVVPANTAVTIKGVAKTINTASDCAVTEKDAPFTWSLQFQEAGGFPGPSPQPLSAANTLTPTFNSGSLPGTFFVTLLAAGRLEGVTIDVTSPQGPPWYSIGPDGSLDTSVGRVNDIAADFSRPGFLYIAAGHGGIWATPDAGGTWWPLTDHKGLPSLAMESVAVGIDGTIYAGTGDTRASESLAVDPGHGVFKSRDSGFTWQAAGTQALPNCSSFTGAAERIVVDPRNASNVYLASSQGVFRSTSSGDCWSKIFASPATDVALAPGDPTTLWVGAPPSGIVQIVNADTTATVQKTIPFVGNKEKWTRIVLSFSPVPNGKAFAVFATGNSATVLHTSASWSSIDHAVQNDSSGNALCTTQCDLNTALAASPISFDTAAYANVNHFQTLDGGATWTSFQNDTIHADARRLLYVPLPFIFPVAALFEVNDGGVWQTGPFDFIAPMWHSRNYGLLVSQPAGLAVSSALNPLVAIGTWDDGTQQRVSGRTWNLVRGGDGFEVSYDSDSASTLYANANAGFGSDIVRTSDGVDIGSFPGFLTNPFRPGEIIGVTGDPNNAKLGLRAFMAENADTAAKLTLACVDPDPSDSGGAFGVDFAIDGSYYVSHTSGNLYRFNAAMPSSALDCATGTAATNVQKIYTDPGKGILIPSVDPFDPTSVYALSTAGSGDSRVVRVTVGASGPPTVATLGSGLPALPFSTIAGDPTASGAVYVGGANGLWRGSRSIDGSMIWQPVGDVPDGLVVALSAHRTRRGIGGPLRANVYGRGVWEQLLTSPPCPGVACLGLGPVECLSCPSGASQFPLTGNPVFSASLSAEFAIRYEYRGSSTAGIFVRAVPLAASVEPPQFIVEERPVQAGSDVALVGVAYVASSRPLGVHTDQIRFEIVDDNQNVVLDSQTAPFDHWWLREDAHLLTVDAVIRDPALRTLASAPLTVTVAGQPPVTGPAPLRVPVPTGANVVVTAHREVKVPGGVGLEGGPPSDELRLALWRFNGQPAGRSASVTEAIWDQAYLAASYEVESEHGHGGPGGCDFDRSQKIWSVIAALMLLAAALLVARKRGRGAKA